jgi:hypothetical protein
MIWNLPSFISNGTLLSATCTHEMNMTHWNWISMNITFFSKILLRVCICLLRFKHNHVSPTHIWFIFNNFVICFSSTKALSRFAMNMKQFKNYCNKFPVNFLYKEKKNVPIVMFYNQYFSWISTCWSQWSFLAYLFKMIARSFFT